MCLDALSAKQKCNALKLQLDPGCNGCLTLQHVTVGHSDTDRQRQTQAHTQTDTTTHTDGHTDIYTDRQTDRQTDTDTDTHSVILAANWQGWQH